MVKQEIKIKCVGCGKEVVIVISQPKSIQVWNKQDKATQNYIA